MCKPPVRVAQTVRPTIRDNRGGGETVDIHTIADVLSYPQKKRRGRQVTQIGCVCGFDSRPLHNIVQPFKIKHYDIDLQTQ